MVHLRRILADQFAIKWVSNYITLTVDKHIFSTSYTLWPRQKCSAVYCYYGTWIHRSCVRQTHTPSLHGIYLCYTAIWNTIHCTALLSDEPTRRWLNQRTHLVIQLLQISIFVLEDEYFPGEKIIITITPWSSNIESLIMFVVCGKIYL